MALTTMERTAEERLQQAISWKVEGRYEDAERELRTILAESPNHLRARHELGLVLGFTGMFDESLEELQRVAQLDPKYIKGRNSLGLTYCMLGYNDEARAEFEAVLEMDPTNAEALRQIQYFR